jgi:hypothetical protein
MLRMCVYMHSRCVENHSIRILEDGPLISEGGFATGGRKHDDVTHQLPKPRLGHARLSKSRPMTTTQLLLRSSRKW